MNADTRGLIHATAAAELEHSKALARLSIAVAGVKLSHAKLASLQPSYWPKGCAQQFEEAEDRNYAISCAREDLSNAKASLLVLERPQ